MASRHCRRRVVSKADAAYGVLVGQVEALHRGLRVASAGRLAGIGPDEASVTECFLTGTTAKLVPLFSVVRQFEFYMKGYADLAPHLKDLKLFDVFNIKWPSSSMQQAVAAAKLTPLLKAQPTSTAALPAEVGGLTRARSGEPEKRRRSTLSGLIGGRLAARPPIDRIGLRDAWLDLRRPAHSPERQGQGDQQGRQPRRRGGIVIHSDEALRTSGE